MRSDCLTCPVRVQFAVSHWPTLVLLDENARIIWHGEGLEGRSRRQMLFFLVISCHPEGVQVVKRIKL
jgi:hypothetical protein